MRNCHHDRRTVGSVDVSALFLLAAIAWLLYVVMLPDAAAPPPPAPLPLPGTSTAYAPYLFIDQVTGCQYLSTHTSTGLAPRIAADGKTHMGCKGGTQ
jgi:hypothetical protein